jgi:hypothetical protein
MKKLGLKLFLIVLIYHVCMLMFLCKAEAKDAFRGTAIATTQLDDDPTSVTSDGIDVSEYDKVAFWVAYDETEVGGGVSGAVTLTVSYDDTTYFAASFYDYAGGATLQTSETISADGNYVFWMNPDFTVRYAKVTITGTGTDTDDLISTSVTFSAQK